VLKRGIERAITSLASLFIVASSLGVSSPVNAATYDGVSGTIDCSSSGIVMVSNNVVTTHSNCSGSVEIPAGVMSVGNTAFDNAVELTGINVHLNNAIFSSSSGVLFNKAATALIRYPSGRSAISYTIPASATSIRRSAFKDAQYIQSVYVPTSVTSIQTLGFSRASNLATVYFLGNAPTSVGSDAFSFVANGAKAVIKSGATGFSNEGQIWNGLIVEDDAYTVTYNPANGSAVSSGSFTTGGTIQTAPISTRAGYTLTGWSTSKTGSVVEFPYSPAATSDITMFAIWIANTVASAPTISSVSAGNRQATVNFSVPIDNGGSEITNFEYSTDGGSTWLPSLPAQTTSPLVITGLSNGTIYSVKVRAINGVGFGVASNSVLVMPRDPLGMLHSALPGGEALAKAMARSSVMASKLTFTSNLLVGDSHSPVDAYNEGVSDVLISGHPLINLSRNSVQVPVSATTISIITNVPKIQTIYLDAATLSAIYKGTITMWDDARIKAMNKLVKLPHLRIRVHYQSGDSDTSKTFFDFLDQTTNDSWTTTSGVITHGLGEESALGVAHDSGTDLVTAMVLDPYSLGFVQTHDVATGVNVAAIKNAAGGFMKPSVAAGSIFLKGTGVLTPSSAVMGTYEIDYTRRVKNAYPLTHLVYLNAPIDSSPVKIQGKQLLTCLNKYLSSNPNIFDLTAHIPLPVRLIASAKIQIESIS
jgi:uncharacterized repeat protein (TIGR02543 family)